MVATAVGTILHIPLCFLFVNGFDFGILGLGVASSLKNLIQLLFYLVYAFTKKEVKPALQALDRETFKGWGMYLKLSLPALIMLCADWWSLQVLTVLAGTFGVE